jgi:hypothetical protein
VVHDERYGREQAVKGDRGLVTVHHGIPKQSGATALEDSREYAALRRELAQEIDDLRIEVVRMKCDLFEAVWRGTVSMMSLLTALLVVVPGISVLLVMKL